MMENQVLERFHRALVEEIQTQRPEYLTGPFTVAEIYQNLVPYGSHRDRIGVEMNGDYEDALLRLLAGEGGYLILESEPALDDIRGELDSTHPNTGLYRDYAAVDVRLNQASLDLSASAVDELSDLADELDVQEPLTMSELAPAPAAPTADDLGIVPPGVDIFDQPPTNATGEPDTAAVEITADEATTEEVEDVDEADDDSVEVPAPPAGGLQPEFVETDEAAPADGSCVWCRATLPERDNVNYCPYCGTDLALVPCDSCGQELEPDWRFCIACGTEATR